MNFSLDALEEALYLSHRFLARDRLPRKALDLLTHAGSLAEDGRTIRELEQLKQRVGFKQRRLFLEVDESVLD